MIRTSFVSYLLYSTRLRVNETPNVEPLDVPKLPEELAEPGHHDLLSTCLLALLLSAGLVVLAQLRPAHTWTSGIRVDDVDPAVEVKRAGEASVQSTPCKDKEEASPSTPSTSSLGQKGKGKAPAPPKGQGKGPKGSPKGAGKGPPSTPKGKGKGTPPKGALASQRSGGLDDAEEAKAANPFGARRIRWRTISDQSGTVFNRLDAPGLHSETRKMLHEVLASSVVQQTARQSAFIPKSSGKCLLSMKRAQQLAIAFRRSPMPLHKLCLALQTLDFSISLTEEEIEGLLKAWPTDVDFRQVASYAGPAEELRDVEQCIRQVAAVPRSEARLKLLRLSRSLDSLSSIFDRVEVLQAACDELMQSEKLQILLQEALHIGNYINGDAGAGFALDAFIQLRSLKGIGGATPLHCLCAGCAEDDPAFSATLHTELANLREAANLSLGSLQEALQRIREDVQSAADELVEHSSHYDSSPAIVELEDTPCAAIQPLGRGARPGGPGHPPFVIPPLHLQMIRAEPLSVTFEQSGEEGSSPSNARSESPDRGSSPRRVASTGAALWSARTPPMAPRAACDLQTPPPRWPRASPQSSPEMSPETTSEDSPTAGGSAPQTIPLRLMPPARPPAVAADVNRPCMPTLRLPEAVLMEQRPDGLCTPRGTSRRAGGSMIREAPPRRSPLASPRQAGSPLTARARLFGEDSTRLYLEGWPVPTPRFPVPLTARSEARSFVLKSARSAAPSPSPRPTAPATDSWKVFSLFIRNTTVKLASDESNVGLNQTEKLVGGSARNCTCGYATPTGNFVGCDNGSARAAEGPIRNVTRPQLLGLEGADSSSSSSASSPGRRRNARAQLHGLIARGRILLERAAAELDGISATITRCERYFGGLSAERKESGGIPLLCAALEVLAAFQQAWEEVHRDDRWARFLPLTSVRTTSRSEASTSRRRRFTPRRSLP